MKLRHYLGISAGFHDAAAAVVDSAGRILFAAHSERYSGIKGDPNISEGLRQELAQYPIDTIAYYERPWLKQLRRLYSGEGVEWDRLTAKQVLGQQLGTMTKNCEIQTHGHHLCHAAAGFQTSPFDRATVVVIDAIGEWDTITIWGAEYREGRARYRRLWSQHYPHSIGLFYSAVTARLGLNPMHEEYITMGMAAYGNPGLGDMIKHWLVQDEYEIRLRHNLHVGMDNERFNYVNTETLALGAQELAENLIYHVMWRARRFDWSANLVYGGGVALNCLANRNLGHYFDRIWILPCPGDSGSSIGSAALAHGGHLDWRDPYLGHAIPGAYPTNQILDHLLSDHIVGVASGSAEFGPRALGNRSLLADPRGAEMRDRVNEIKRRQKFRPFAPAILAEHVDDYFDMPHRWTHSPYMQVTAQCRRPDLYPAIVHRNGTSRVQTVSRDSGTGLRELLEKWYLLTGCPMLLNTSLNVRGEPMVNDREDADRFENLYGVKVCS